MTAFRPIWGARINLRPHLARAQYGRFTPGQATHFNWAVVTRFAPIVHPIVHPIDAP